MPTDYCPTCGGVRTAGQAQPDPEHVCLAPMDPQVLREYEEGVHLGWQACMSDPHKAEIRKRTRIASLCREVRRLQGREHTLMAEASQCNELRHQRDIAWDVIAFQGERIDGLKDLIPHDARDTLKAECQAKDERLKALEAEVNTTQGVER